MLTRCEVAPHKSLKKKNYDMRAVTPLSCNDWEHFVCFRTAQFELLLICWWMRADAWERQTHYPNRITRLRRLQGSHFLFPAEAVDTLQGWLVEEGLRAKLDN